MALGLALSACAKDEFVTRAATEDGPGAALLGAAEAPALVSRDYSVENVEVVVPESLEVSYANSFFPKADIVWWGDPVGDRRAQVDALITEAVKKGVADLDGARKVNLVLEVTRFHAITEKTRFAAPPGTATHDIKMMLTVLDAETGEVIEPAHPVGVTFEAHTGTQALADMAEGITQKDRITEKLVELMHMELG
ncbi:MAG: hypothetical protein D6801_01305 [Alphaproteobacteria bacterium]|nr:MAG: hypothetical protein D6801_01305 [Alphaproteobacteria bacterium]